MTQSPTQTSRAAGLDFLSPISAIKGFGPRRVEGLAESGIETIGDLLYHFPRRYLDRSTIVPIGQIGNFINASCTIVGTVDEDSVERWGRGRLRALIRMIRERWNCSGSVQCLHTGTCLLPASG